MTCKHPRTEVSPQPQTLDGCTSCVAEGRSDWVHLRICQNCGHVGCCDSSPAKHATKHGNSEHPLVRSFEPNEDWWFCYVDQDLFMADGAAPAPTRIS